MKSYEVARLFERMADVLELGGENACRIRAYRRAAQNLETLGVDIETLAREDRLDQIPGVGGDLAGKIAEYLETGRIAGLDAACRKVPRGVVELLDVPGIGPKTARQLYERHGVTGVAKLERLAAAGKLRGLPGIQARTEQNILRGIRLLRGGQARMPLGRALPLGRELVRALADAPGVESVTLAGSLRRMKETVGDIDLLVTATDPSAAVQAFTGLRQAAQMLERGTTKAAFRHRGGIRVDLRVVAPEAYGEAHPEITVLAGSECDILSDGRLDYPDDVLAELDIVIGAVHTRFKQSRREMTARICAALANPHVHVLGHPTGRLLGERGPYEVDLDEVLRAARRHDKAVEINAYPDRLDVGDVHARRARELGAPRHRHRHPHARSPRLHGAGRGHGPAGLGGGGGRGEHVARGEAPGVAGGRAVSASAMCAPGGAPVPARRA